MRTARLLGVLLATLGGVGCLWSEVSAERVIERSFTVSPDSVVEVALAGGNVRTVTGPTNRVRVSLRLAVGGWTGQREAKALLAGVQVTQDGPIVRVQTDRGRDGRAIWWRRSSRITATITVPAAVTLKVATRGGRVRVDGHRDGDVFADTHGGSVDVDGGRGRLVLSTAGGDIRIGRALGSLRADARGGRIDIAYIGPTAHEVELGASGGSIRVGIDPAARLSLITSTTGGGIDLQGLQVDTALAQQSQLDATLNGGSGGWVRASTRGGSIALRAASDPG